MIQSTTTRLLIACCFALLLGTENVLAQTTFQMAYGGADDDVATKIVKTPNGRYMLVGNSASYSAMEDAFVVVIDSAGRMVWERNYGTASNVQFAEGAVELGGKVYLSGYTDDQGPATINGSVMQIDPATGNLISATAYGAILLEELINIERTPDANLMAFGFTFQNGLDMFVTKLDTNGIILWSRFVGGPGNAEISFSSTATSDNGALLTGVTDQGIGSDDIIVVKLDSLGSLQWAKGFGTTQQESVTDALEIDDGYLLTGSSGGFGGTDAYLMKLDSAGNQVWMKTYGGTGFDIAREIIKDGDSYVIVGQTASFGAGMVDGMMMRVDSAGTLEWFRTYGGTADDMLEDVQIALDGGYIAAGRTESFGPAMANFYAIKTDQNGVSGCNESLIATVNSLDTAFTNNNLAGIVSTSAGTRSVKTWNTGTPMVTRDSLCSGFVCNVSAAIALTDTAFCQGDSLIATDLTVGSSVHNWTLGGVAVGGNQQQVIPMDSIGTRSLTLITGTATCNDTLDTLLTVHPHSTLTLNTNMLCEGDTLMMVNTTPGATGGAWSVNGMQFTNALTADLLVLSAGSFTLTLNSDPGNCPTDTIFTVSSLPTAAFNASGMGLVWSFQDASLSASSWLWDFGDGNTSTNPTPTNIYATPGAYTVCLTVTNTAGCEDSTCMNIDVLVGLESGISPQLTVHPNPVGEQLVVTLGTLPVGEVRWEIIDIRGQSVLAGREWLRQPQFVLQTDQLPGGIYFLRVAHDGRTDQIKLVKRE